MDVGVDMAKKEKTFRQLIEEEYRKRGGRGKVTGELRQKGIEAEKKADNSKETSDNA
jgi:hypothetical protein